MNKNGLSIRWFAVFSDVFRSVFRNAERNGVGRNISRINCFDALQLGIVVNLESMKGIPNKRE